MAGGVYVNDERVIVSVFLDWWGTPNRSHSAWTYRMRDVWWIAGGGQTFRGYRE